MALSAAASIDFNLRTPSTQVEGLARALVADKLSCWAVA